MNQSIISLPILFPLLSAVFVLGLGIFVFSKNVNNILNRLFGLVSVVFVMWLFGTFMMFIANLRGNDSMVIFWDRFIYIGVVFMPPLEYHFSLAFANRKANKLVYFGYILSILFLFLSRTDYFVSGLFKYRWGAHTVAQIGHHFFMIFFFFYIFALLFTLYKYRRDLEDRQEQTKIFLVILAFAILNLVGGLGYLPAYQIGVFPVSLIAPTIFALIIGYTIIKYNFLEIKTFATQVFIFFILSVSFADVFFSNNLNEYILRSVFFAAIGFFSFLLIRSIEAELSRKEELQLMSNKLAQANDQLRKLDNAKSEFISIASHQLRTPLTAIKGFISLMLEGSYGKMAPEQVDVLNKVYSSNERLVNLVEDLLNISRIESGRMEFQFDKWKIEDICQEVIDTFVLRAKEHKLYLEYKKPDQPLPELIIDGVKVREVISNLVDNAIKYTLEGKGGVTLKVEQWGESIRVTVSDTGIGIPESELPYLFAKFSRGKDTSRLNTGGTGLGLYVGKTMIENNGGKIWAESDGAGLGSRFIIELPIVKHKEEAEERLQKFINKI